MLMIGVNVTLLIRSLLHLAAGLRGVSGAGTLSATDATNRYTSFAVISSVIIGGLMFIMLMMAARDLVALIAVGLFIYLLLIWPTALRRFFTERNFAVMLAGSEAPLHRRAPDAGLTALGWLLMAVSVVSLATSVPQALLGIDSSEMLALLVRSAAVAEGDLADVGNAWWNVAVAALQLWAAIELVRMTDRHRLAASIYGVIATLTTVYFSFPIMKSLFSSAIGKLGDPSVVFPYAWLATTLVIPIGTLLLVNRKLTPQARASVRAEA
jgi:hypothetical protein